jgi:DNA topoisomerase-1
MAASSKSSVSRAASHRLVLALNSREEAAADRSPRHLRLRRSNPSLPGYTRIRLGPRFGYRDVDGSPLTDPEALLRIEHLAIPPAWRDVWICPDPLGHLQATGVDTAGRLQYRYHDRWREQQDHKKFTHMVAFAQTLPGMRQQVIKTMRASARLDRARVLACAVRLLDVGLFRIGSEVYEREDRHLGLATIAKANVSAADGQLVFDYIAKEGVRRLQTIEDPLCTEIVAALKRRRGGGEHLFAYRDGREWHPVHSQLINDFLKRLIGQQFSAKNFRTWNGTVLAAVSLAGVGRDATSQRARQRAIAAAARDVSEVLGNTPAVARRSYIDPRVFDRFLCGWTIASELGRGAALDATDDQRRAVVERAVLDLLAADHHPSQSATELGEI